MRDGEIIEIKPGDFAVDEEPKEEPKPEEKEAPEPKPEETPAPEAKPDEDEVTKTFKELGLDRQFRDPLDALRRIPEHNREITRLQQDRGELNRRLSALEAQPKPEPKPDEPLNQDKFFENPIDVLRQQGFVKKDEVESATKPLIERMAQLEQEREAERVLNFLRSKDELKPVAEVLEQGGTADVAPNQFWAAIQQLSRQYPMFQRMPYSESLPLLYDLAKARTGSVVQPQGDTKPNDKKASAQTTSGRSAKPKEEGDVARYIKMTETEIEKEIGFGTS